MQQFEDHQHYKAAVRLSLSNHQVQILFVRACINMYLSLWKTVPGKQLWPPSKSRKSTEAQQQPVLMAEQKYHYICSNICQYLENRKGLRGNSARFHKGNLPSNMIQMLRAFPANGTKTPVKSFSVHLQWDTKLIYIVHFLQQYCSHSSFHIPTATIFIWRNSRVQCPGQGHLRDQTTNLGGGNGWSFLLQYKGLRKQTLFYKNNDISLLYIRCIMCESDQEKNTEKTLLLYVF